MIYKLNDIELAHFGAVPVCLSEKSALEGVFSLPQRKGITQYNWGTSIEPYVDAEDIELDGLDMVLNVAIVADTKTILYQKLETFQAACISCTKLSTEYDSFDVLCAGEIKVVEYDLAVVISASFIQSEVIIPPLTLIPSGTGNYRLDDYDLRADFGMYVSKIDGIKDVGGRISVNTTELYNKTQYRELREITITLLVMHPRILDLRAGCDNETITCDNETITCDSENYISLGMYSRLNQFKALCVKEGLRTFVFPDNQHVSLYFKDGFKGQFINTNILKFTLKATVVV